MSAIDDKIGTVADNIVVLRRINHVVHADGSTGLTATVVIRIGDYAYELTEGDARALVAILETAAHSARRFKDGP